MTCVPSKDSDQPGQISLGICPVWSDSSLSILWVARNPSYLHFRWTVKTLIRLIWVLAGCTSHFNGFIMLQLSCFFTTIARHVMTVTRVVVVFFFIGNMQVNDMNHIMRKPVYAICEQQRRRSRSLISASVVHCLDSIKPLIAIAKISRP